MIVGFQRCGQSSLLDSLKDKYPYAVKTEILHRFDGVRLFKQQHIDNYFPVIITRWRPAVIWSRYFYFGHDHKMTLAEYLCNNQPGISPLFETDFDYHVKRWAKLNPKMYRLEPLTKDRKFPHVVDQGRKKTFRAMTSDDLKLIEGVIRNYEHKFKISYDD